MSTLDLQVAKVFQPLWEPARNKVARGGRGSGKSHDRATHLVIKGATQPTRWACVREVQQSLKQSVKQLLTDKIAKLNLGGQYRILEDRIEGHNGTLFTFHGMRNHTADTIKSLEGYDGAWVEEAQTLSRRSLKMLRPTIRKPGSELWFTYNPRYQDDPVDVDFRGSDLPPDSVVVEANYYDNPWFPDVLREEMEWDKRKDLDEYRHIWLGQYSSRTDAQVFRNWRVDKITVPSHAIPYYGADWGFSKDPTVFLRAWMWDRTIHVDQMVYKEGVEIDHLPALFDQVQGGRDYPSRADSARPETISYMKRHGYPRMVKAKKGKDSVKDGVEFLKSHEIVVSSAAACKPLEQELKTYLYKIDPHTDEVLPELIDANNHAIDALRYALEQRRIAQNKPEAGAPILIEAYE